MNVSEIMTAEVISVSLDTPVDEVAKVLLRHHVSGVPVLDAAGVVRGVVTESDLIVRNANLHLPTYLDFFDAVLPIRRRREFAEEMRRTLATTAGQVMGEHLHTVQIDADVADVATLMMDTGANPIPVVAAGKPIGIVSRADIVRLMVREQEITDGEPLDG